MKSLIQAPWFRSCLLAVVLVVVGTAAGTAPAEAAQFSILGSYMDTDDLQDAPGLGLRVAFFDQIQLQITASWYDKFDGVVLGPPFQNPGATQLPATTPVVIPMELFPIDVGGAYYFDQDATGAYVGGGLSYYFLESKLGNINTDNEFGFYLQLGYQAGGNFFGEIVYRMAEGTLEGVPVVGPERFRDVKYDLNAIAASIGWRF